MASIVAVQESFLHCLSDCRAKSKVFQPHSVWCTKKGTLYPHVLLVNVENWVHSRDLRPETSFVAPSGAKPLWLQWVLLVPEKYSCLFKMVLKEVEVGSDVLMVLVGWLVGWLVVPTCSNWHLFCHCPDCPEVHHMTFELIPDATSPREAKDSTQEEECHVGARFQNGFHSV